VAYNARVFQILIASPGDVQAERKIISEVIHDWNYLNSTEKSVVLLPLRYETHSSPELNERRQDRINGEVVDHCDMAVGVFWTRLGTPTGDAESGTAEEIQRVGDAGKPVMLYFSREPIAPDQLDPQQLHRLQEFRKTFPSGQVEDYATTAEFRDQFARHLALKVRELVARDTGDENRDTELVAHAGLQLRLAAEDSLALLPEDAVFEVEQVVCTDPDAVTNLHRGALDSAVLANAYSRFRLVLVNAGSQGLQHVNVDAVVTSTGDEFQLLSMKRPLFGDDSWRDPVTAPRYIDLLHLDKPRDQFISMPATDLDTWRMELGVPAVQAGRTVFSRNEFWVNTTMPAVIAFDCTVYSSNAAPFTKRVTLEIRLTRREMTCQEIVRKYEAAFLD
jgi:hypothetical protein